jgi:hypothetical protein
MAAQVPIRTVFDGDTATGLAEFQSGEFLALTYGGLGASLSIGSAGQVLKVNSGASALEFGVVSIDIDTATDLTARTLVAGDQILASDGGTEGRVALSQLDTLFSGTSKTLTNKTLTTPTITGTAVMVDLDISGDVDIDGTLEADAITVDGVALSTFIRDAVGTNMLSSNTESGITVTYDTSNDNIDFAINAAQTTITSIFATDLKIGEDDQTKIDFEEPDEIHFYAANVEQVYVADGVFGPQTDSDVDLGTTGVRWKNAFIDSITTTGDVTVGGTTTQTGVSTSTATDIFNAGLSVKNGATSAGFVQFFEDSDNGTNKVTLVGPAAVADITVVLPAAAGTIALANADTSGNAATATALEAAVAINGVNFDGSAAITVTAAAGTLSGDTLKSSVTASSLTSVGTLTNLQVDFINANASTLSITDSSDTGDKLDIAVAANGATTITTTDDDGAAANLQITADGTAELAGTTVTLDSEGDIVLDANGADVFVKDNGTTFGSLTNTSGNLIIKSGTTTALTFSGANITGSGTYNGGGTMTTGGNIIIPNAGNIGSVGDTDALAISSGGVVTFSQAPVFSSGGAGKVLQVVQGLGNAEFDTTSTSFVKCTNLNATITPSASSSKILIQIMGLVKTEQYTRYMMMSIFRNINGGGEVEISDTGTATDDTANGFLRIYDAGTSITEQHATVIYVDSPNTTSATVYSPAIRHGTGNSAGAHFGVANAKCVMILTEIAG